ncbi:MAG: hypothetical protein WCQ50_17005 [Spirochaetota bacterium]
MSATGTPAAELLAKISPDILKSFATIPAYGSLGFVIHFVDGEVARLEFSGSIQKKIVNRGAR